MLDCFRALDGVTPFIDSKQQLTLEVKQTDGGEYRGVCFSTQPTQISPHISLTHCECSLHVYCRDVASSLSDVLVAKPELATDLFAVHIKAQPQKCIDLGYSVQTDEDGVTTAVYAADKYTIYSESPVSSTHFDEDRIVTKATIQSGIQALQYTNNPRVILIDIVGEENCMNNWAYMSNEAVAYLVNEVGVEVIVLNTASIDRESDGGHVGNHKIVFAKRNNLVVELARLSHLTAGCGTVRLNIEPHSSYADCGACRVQFQPLP